MAPPTFSPDGQRVAFERYTPSENSLLTAALDGSGERVLVSYKRPENISNRVVWSPDGRTLAFIHFSPWPVLTTIEAEGGQPQPVAGTHWNYIQDLTWLPGGRDLVVAGIPLRSEGAALYEVSLEGGEARRITHDLSLYTQVRASADGKTLLALQYQALMTLQVATPGKESEARTLSSGNQSGDGGMGLAWTSDGKIVYASIPNGHWDLWEMGADGSNPQSLTNNDASSGSYYPAVSLRGGFIAFTQRDHRNGKVSIWGMDTDGTNLKQLTPADEYPPAVSPDGRWVIFTRGESGKLVLMKIAREGGSAVQLTDYNASEPSVSPDGKWIACRYFPSQDQPVTLAVIPFEGGQPAKVFTLHGTVGGGINFGVPFLWTPDGRSISYVNSINGVGNIWEQPVAGGPPKAVTHFTSDKIFWFDWSRDGRLALSRGTEPTDAVLIKNYK